MLISELSFSSFLSYTPKFKAVEWMEKIKYDKRHVDRSGKEWDTSEYLARCFMNQVPLIDRAVVFPKGAVLVPMPKSALPLSGGLWVPERIAKALIREGLGARVANLLSRKHAIRKSATCPKGERPLAQEIFESLKEVRRELGDFSRLVIVDDLITAGANAIGAASRLREAFPYSLISCFAMMRTISRTEDFRNVVDFVSGTVLLKPNGKTIRRP